MKEHPITFSGEMVRAIIAGRKTQTRRVVNPQPPSVAKIRATSGSDYGWVPAGTDSPGLFLPSGPVWAVREAMLDNPTPHKTPMIRCPYGAKGMRLWVREKLVYMPLVDNGVAKTVGYAADGTLHPAAEWVWKRYMLPAMFCPRALSRITLEITDVRVEQVQEISEADAVAEGVTGEPEYVSVNPYGSPCTAMIYRPAFARLWDAINGKKPGRAWADNPWVWVVEFRAPECE